MRRDFDAARFFVFVFKSELFIIKDARRFFVIHLYVRYFQY